jgi:hypothetical protein
MTRTGSKRVYRRFDPPCPAPAGSFKPARLFLRRHGNGAQHTASPLMPGPGPEMSQPASIQSFDGEVELATVTTFVAFA